MSDNTAQHNDTVVAVATSWKGYEVFTGDYQVDKTYKNGNVVLKGVKGQFYHMPTADGYKLSQCSGSMQLVKLTDDVKLRIEKSIAIQELFAAQYELEKAFQKSRRSVNKLNIHELRIIKDSFVAAIKLINGDSNEIND